MVTTAKQIIFVFAAQVNTVHGLFSVHDQLENTEEVQTCIKAKKILSPK